MAPAAWNQPFLTVLGEKCKERCAVAWRPWRNGGTNEENCPSQLKEAAPPGKGSYQGYVRDNKSPLHYQGQPENIIFLYLSGSSSCCNDQDETNRSSE